MEKIIIKLKNRKRKEELISILNKIDFVEVEEISEAEKNEDNEDNILSLFGLWADRDIDLNEIRTKGWSRI